MSVDGYVIRREHGTITVTPAALQRLVVGAAESVDGARVRRPRRALELTIGGRCAEVSLALTAREGIVLPDLARAVQERVADAVRVAGGRGGARVGVAVGETGWRRPAARTAAPRSPPSPRGPCPAARSAPSTGGGRRPRRSPGRGPSPPAPPSSPAASPPRPTPG